MVSKRTVMPLTRAFRVTGGLSEILRGRGELGGAAGVRRRRAAGLRIEARIPDPDPGRGGGGGRTRDPDHDGRPRSLLS